MSLFRVVLDSKKQQLKFSNLISDSQLLADVDELVEPCIILSEI